MGRGLRLEGSICTSLIIMEGSMLGRRSAGGTRGWGKVGQVRALLRSRASGKGRRGREGEGGGGGRGEGPVLCVRTRVRTWDRRYPGEVG